MKVAVVPSRWVKVRRHIVLPVHGPGHQLYSSIEYLPLWMQERYAVLRLLEEGEETPLGMWRIDRAIKQGTLFLYIVRLPGDPEWEK